MTRKQQSLRRRLLISAALLLLLFLGIMGVGLNKAFEQSVLSNAEDALHSQILILISNIDIFDGELSVASESLDARLSQPDSDLFAQVSTMDKGVVWRSESLLDQHMPELSSQLGEFHFYPLPKWPEMPKMYATALNVEWETEQGDLPFTIQVAEKTRSYEQRMRAYRKQIMTWLLVLGGSLLALLLASLTWALRPLVKVIHQVTEIEQGTRQRFDEDYPSEVSRLTQNLNQLLNVEEQRIRHQKEVLGNLAHSLKTPVAVLKGIKYSANNQTDVDNQLDTIQNIIDYQLQSASTVGRRRFAKAIEVGPLTNKILNSLEKIYAEKNINITLENTNDAYFYGDEGDWMELCGNLLENAFKWAESEVGVNIRNLNAQNGALDESRKEISLVVSDDGPGVNDERKLSILQRGVRLDSQTPGHGLGLNIVKGIVDAYEGELSIEDNSPKGTIFSVVLT